MSFTLSFHCNAGRISLSMAASHWPTWQRSTLVRCSPTVTSQFTPSQSSPQPAGRQKLNRFQVCASWCCFNQYHNVQWVPLPTRFFRFSQSVPCLLFPRWILYGNIVLENKTWRVVMWFAWINRFTVDVGEHYIYSVEGRNTVHAVQ